MTEREPAPASASVFGEDAPDRFDPAYLARFGKVFEVLARVFRHEVRGLERIPRRGPALLVLNHGPFPIDAALLSWTLHRELGRWPRFLGDRLIFEEPLFERFFAPWGVVEGNHYEARKLFAAGELVAVFPGGAREAWKGVRERKRLRWAGRSGFARLAFKSDVPIVPVACPRADDLLLVLNDPLAWGARVFGESRHLPLPVFVGLGLLPIPWKVVHTVGEPILPERRRGETGDEAVERIRGEAEAAMQALLRA